MSAELMELYFSPHQILKETWQAHRKPTTRIEWDDLYLNLAAEIGKRSPDAQTKVGVFLVDKDYTPISFGYNGFPRDVDDSLLPNIRPPSDCDKYDIQYKYAWIIHAEVNAVLNAARHGKNTTGSIMYSTLPPCEKCSLFLWQAGIREVVYSKSNHSAGLDTPEYRKFMDAFNYITNNRMQIRGV